MCLIFLVRRVLFADEAYVFVVSVRAKGRPYRSRATALDEERVEKQKPRQGHPLLPRPDRALASVRVHAPILAAILAAILAHILAFVTVEPPIDRARARSKHRLDSLELARRELDAETPSLIRAKFVVGERAVAVDVRGVKRARQRRRAPPRQSVRLRVRAVDDAAAEERRGGVRGRLRRGAKRFDARLRAIAIEGSRVALGAERNLAPSLEEAAETRLDGVGGEWCVGAVRRWGGTRGGSLRGGGGGGDGEMRGE